MAIGQYMKQAEQPNSPNHKFHADHGLFLSSVKKIQADKSKYCRAADIARHVTHTVCIIIKMFL